MPPHQHCTPPDPTPARRHQKAKDAVVVATLSTPLSKWSARTACGISVASPVVNAAAVSTLPTWTTHPTVRSTAEAATPNSTARRVLVSAWAQAHWRWPKSLQTSFIYSSSNDPLRLTHTHGLSIQHRHQKQQQINPKIQPDQKP